MSLKLHRELWDALYRKPGMRKEDWSNWKHIKRLPMSLCFACQAARDKKPIGRCEECPLVWGTEEAICMGDSHGKLALFSYWSKSMREYHDTNNFFMRIYYRFHIRRAAKKIRDLPVKESWKSHRDWSE